MELFDPKYNQDINTSNVAEYLPNHPTFIKFRKLLRMGIRAFSDKYGYDICIPEFLTEFNSNLMIKLKEEKSKNKYLENLLYKWRVHQDFIYIDNIDVVR